MRTLNTRDQAIFRNAVKVASGGGGGHGTKRKRECFDAWKAVGSTLISSKVLSLISRDKMARRKKQALAQGQNEMPLFIRGWKSSTGTMQTRKIRYSQPSTSTTYISNSNSGSPSYRPGSGKNESGVRGMSWRTMWLHEPNVYAKSSIQRSRKCWTPESQWLARMDSC